MPQLKRLLMIATGGTIASKSSGQGLEPVLTTDEILQLVPEINRYGTLHALQLFNLDSTNMTPAHWIRLARTIRDHYDQYDGFVVTHGTDTMAYAVAAVSYLIQNSPKPVVFTGAQQSICQRDTDARSNLIGAVMTAADQDAWGVSLVFDNRVIIGTRARKMRTKSFNAFSSVDFPELAVIRSGRLIWYIREPRPQQVCFYDRLEPAVFVLKLIPGMDPGIFDYIAAHYRAVVIESFGVGGIPYYDSEEFSEKIEKLIGCGVKVIISTQVPHEGSDMEVYSVGFRIKKKYELLEAYDMTVETIVAKTMWALALTDDDEAFRRLFRTPVSRDVI